MKSVFRLAIPVALACLGAVATAYLLTVRAGKRNNRPMTYIVGQIRIGGTHLTVGARSDEWERTKEVRVAEIQVHDGKPMLSNDVGRPPAIVLVDSSGAELPLASVTGTALGMQTGGTYRVTYGKRVALSGAFGLWDLVRVETMRRPPGPELSARPTSEPGRGIAMPGAM